jgi:1-aminocyclopropane-1-carboxylate deaminase/D-cysteine desulfhydrase-like pyridoxal-dependent ACC family enzyme
VLSRVDLVHDHIGAGYGHPPPTADADARRLAGAGLVLDPTYTAKAAADVLACLDAGRGGAHLLWHTLAPEPPRPDHLDAPELSGSFRRYLRL